MLESHQISSTLMPWPLVIVLEDTFHAESAQIVIEAALWYPPEARGLALKFWAEAAREGVNHN